jgi:hypothetical protein
MIRATDEETAKDLVKVQFKLLSKKYDKLHDRIEKAAREIDKANARELENALLDYYYEIDATNKRLENCVKRLDNLIQADPSHVNLTAIRKFADKADFDKISLGDWMPNKGYKAAPGEPHQFSHGLVPARPMKKGASKPVNLPPSDAGGNLPGVENLKQ